MSMSNKQYICPVCGYVGFDDPPWSSDLSPSYDICPSCGIEFGYDDFRPTEAERKIRWEELRHDWITNGMQWSSRVDPMPHNWDPAKQLRGIGIGITEY
jgi:rubredoxin